MHLLLDRQILLYISLNIGFPMIVDCSLFPYSCGSNFHLDRRRLGSQLLWLPFTHPACFFASPSRYGRFKAPQERLRCRLFCLVLAGRSLRVGLYHKYLIHG